MFHHMMRNNSSSSSSSSSTMLGYWLGLRRWHAATMTTTTTLTTTRRKEQKKTSADVKEEKECWPLSLPRGAEHIIQQLAAEQILFELLDNKLPHLLQQQQQQQQHSYSSSRVVTAVDFDEIQRLVVAYPATCHREYDFSWTTTSSSSFSDDDDATTTGGGSNRRRLFPLSLLCCLNAPLSVIQTVYTAYPVAIQAVETTRGSLPLHFVSAFDSNMDVVRFIYQKYKKAICTKRGDGVYPIHLAAMYHNGGESSDKISFLLDEYPEGATQLCDRNSSHGHHRQQQQQQQHAAAAEASSPSSQRFHWSALHSAADGCVSDEHVLNRLWQLHPESITARDSRMQTPLHLACENRRWYSAGNNNNNNNHHNMDIVVSFFVRAAPQALVLQDASGFTPLFLAAIYQPQTVLRTILDLLDDPHTNVNVVVATSDPQTGATLLHYAAAHNPHTTVVDFLATRFPEMIHAQTRNDNDNNNNHHHHHTPLSCACFHNHTPLENIRTLIRHDPRTLLWTDGQGRTLVEATASQLEPGVRKDTVLQLLEKELHHYFPNHHHNHNSNEAFLVEPSWPW